MPTIPEALAIALQHHQAGRLGQAEQLYRQILAAEPNRAEAWHLLGVAALQAGQHEAAVECIGRAIALKADVAVFHNNLGEAYRNLRRIPDALDCFRRALELTPDFPEVYNNLGNAWKDQGKLDQALACYRQATQLKPDYAKAHCNLGVACQALEKLDEALACFRRALQLQPDLAEAHNNLASALIGLGQPNEALACYRRAVLLKPDDADLHNNLGGALADLGTVAEAVACYRRAVELRPDDAELLSNLGNALNNLGMTGEALAVLHRALQLKPDSAGIQGNLGVAYKNQGRLAEALACFRRALELQPDLVGAHSNLLFTLQYCADATPAALAAAHAGFQRAYAAPLRSGWTPHENRRDRQVRLRVGFVSPDLGWHPVGDFLVRVLENLSRSPIETVCYSDRALKDHVSQRLQAAATRWHDVAGLSDQRLARQIRSDRIDVLFDLAGHTAHNRLLAFARKPAPVQMTWIGYEGTTGLAAIDYLLADRHMVPAGKERHYCEQVLRMPEGYVCFDPPAAAPPVGPLPARGPGEVTLGSFNNVSKLTPEVVRVWAEILRRLPKARLVLKYRGLGEPCLQQRYRELFAGYGVDAGRLTLLPHSTYVEYLAAYGQIDLALDPFPFSGSATTCEALWMGVPVVTCPGETFASRHSLSHLSNVGLTETIAGDLEHYVEIAVRLAHDLPRLAAIRARLRQQMAASPLCDGPRFAAHLTDLLREVWQRWCAGSTP